MTEYKPGDWVLIRAQVLLTEDEEGDYRIRFPYRQNNHLDHFVAASVIMGTADAPTPPEPEHACLVIDQDDAVWRWNGSEWAHKMYRHSWPDLVMSYGPVEIVQVLP